MSQRTLIVNFADIYWANGGHEQVATDYANWICARMNRRSRCSGIISRDFDGHTAFIVTYTGQNMPLNTQVFHRYGVKCFGDVVVCRAIHGRPITRKSRSGLLKFIQR